MAKANKQTVDVAKAVLTDGKDLAAWVAKSVAYVQSLPEKKKGH